MESIKEIYKIGYGPSSSHTMGPRAAAEAFKIKHPTSHSFKVTLYGSLAATGKGHLTDVAIIEELAPYGVEVVWQPKIFLEKHPNGMKFEAIAENKKSFAEWIVYSVGGGKITDFTDNNEAKKIYPLTTMADILSWTKDNGRHFWEYVAEYEDDDIFEYLAEVWSVMRKTIHRGISEEGRLPGDLNLSRKAPYYYTRASSFRQNLKRRSLVFAYALAASEENACGGKVVTAPTCGASGVIPGVFYLLNTTYGMSKKKMIRGLAVAGLIGNIIKKNASISGAEVGCQGEVGSACAMASGGAAYIFGGTQSQIEYSASIGLEHFLGLTCDPVHGLVQIPCIERNAMAAARAIDASVFALLSDGTHYVAFDKVVKTMLQTGHDLPSIYKETSEGGLALFAKKANCSACVS